MSAAGRAHPMPAAAGGAERYSAGHDDSAPVQASVDTVGDGRYQHVALLHGSDQFIAGHRIIIRAQRGIE